MRNRNDSRLNNEYAIDHRASESLEPAQLPGSGLEGSIAGTVGWVERPVTAGSDLAGTVILGSEKMVKRLETEPMPTGKWVRVEWASKTNSRGFFRIGSEKDNKKIIKR